ncbi:Na+/H+ antiporter subunit E [Thermanaerosceptrum fracticalcis]|nr:Na+/H+ antiporter subunit E [Thermanaerosceptrum fracticalcis]
MNKNADKKTKINGSELLQFIVLTITLFGFWLILSGMMKTKFLIIGFGTSLVTAWLTRSLLRLPSAAGQNEAFLAFHFPYLKYLTYWLWLLGEVVKANIDVVKLVLDPKMPINPQIITFKKPMANPIAHVTLANSITLTPGTVTIDLEDGVYYVHAITEEAARSLVPEEGEGDMLRRVACLFHEQETVARGGEMS